MTKTVNPFYAARLQRVTPDELTVQRQPQYATLHGNSAGLQPQDGERKAFRPVKSTIANRPAGRVAKPNVVKTNPSELAR